MPVSKETEDSSEAPLDLFPSVWPYLDAMANKRKVPEEQDKADDEGVPKYAAWEEDEGHLTKSSESAVEEVVSFRCHVTGCDRWLSSVHEQEVHYASCHRYSCSVCRAQLASYHLLELHLEEQHDSVFQVRAKKQPMYRCYLESCTVLSENASVRHQHCCTEHSFPADYSPCAPVSDVTSRPSQLTEGPGSRDRTEPPAGVAAGGAGYKFSYKIPETGEPGLAFGEEAVRSFRVGTFWKTGSEKDRMYAAGPEIDMKSLSSALDEELR